MLELRGISAGYGDTLVLRGVDLVVPPGVVVALLGPNGAGKTTLLRVASGLLRARSGTLVLDDDDVTRAHSDELARRGLCHVPEGRGIFRSLTVKQNVLLQARPGTENEAVDRAVDAFPVLGRRLGQRAGTMSGGEQQMLALARAYVSEPRIVLLDEVSMGLAPKLVDEVFEFLGRLAAAGTALLLVEQYVTRALALADHVYLLNRGQVAFAGEPREVAGDDLLAHYMGVAS